MITRLILSAAFLSLLSCSPSEADKAIEAQNRKADSLSERINQPELKAVNGELVEDPNNPDLYIKRAKIYLGLKEYNAALGDSKLAIKLDSSQASYYLNLVDVYYAMNNTRSAKETLLAIEKKFPDNSEALLKLAELYYLVKQYQEAITYVNKSLRLDENQARAYHLKGNIYREIGDTAKAISSFQTAVEQDNAFADGYYDIAVMYAARKNPVALEYLNNALRVSPSHAQALYAKAKFYQDTEQYDVAISEYEKALTKLPGCETCAYNLGAIYLNIKKDYKKALEQFSKAIAINPNYLEAYFARGYTYFLLGDKNAARAEYKMCLQLEPNNELAIEGLNQLDAN